MTSTNFLFVIFFVLYATEQIYGSPPKQFGPRCPQHLPSPRPNRRGSSPRPPPCPLPRIGEDSDSFEIGNGPKPNDIYAHIPPFTKPLPPRIQQLQEEDAQCDPHRRPPSPRPRRRGGFSMPGPTDEENPEDNEITGRHSSHHHRHHHPHHHHHHHHHHHSHGHQHRHHPGCDCGCSQGPNLETNDIE